MRRPLAPPPIDIEQLTTQPDVLGRLLQVQQPSRYLHWDEVRHRPPPNGLSVEQWWWGLKLARKVEPIPLKDKSKRPFGFNLTPSIRRRLHHIDMLVGGRSDVGRQVHTDSHRDRYLFNTLLEEAVTSSQLEGAATTRQEAADMIRRGQKPKNKHEQMILNNFLAIRQIRELSDRPLSLESLLKIHRILVVQTLDNPQDAGRFQRPNDRRVQVVDHQHDTVLHVPPDASELPVRAQAMFEFANQSTADEPFVHPVIRAIILHFWLAYDHPFSDGNGRCARALFYWAMLRADYRLFEFISISRVIKKAPVRYGRAFLYTETDDNDLTYFIDHQLAVICEAIDDLELYLEKKVGEVQRVQNLLQSSVLNHRQIALLSHAVRNPGHEYTVVSHQNSHRISNGTARTDLADLAEQGLLLASTRGKVKMVFIAPADTEDRLRRYGKS